MKFTEEEITEMAENYAEKYADYGNHKHGFIAGFKKAISLLNNSCVCEIHDCEKTCLQCENDTLPI